MSKKDSGIRHELKQLFRPRGPRVEKGEEVTPDIVSVPYTDVLAVPDEVDHHPDQGARVVRVGTVGEAFGEADSDTAVARGCALELHAAGDFERLSQESMVPVAVLKALAAGQLTADAPMRERLSIVTGVSESELFPVEGSSAPGTAPKVDRQTFPDDGENGLEPGGDGRLSPDEIAQQRRDVRERREAAAQADADAALQQRLGEIDRDLRLQAIRLKAAELK